jgi:hypothetical protein
MGQLRQIGHGPAVSQMTIDALHDGGQVQRAGWARWPAAQQRSNQPFQIQRTTGKARPRHPGTWHRKPAYPVGPGLHGQIDHHHTRSLSGPVIVGDTRPG